MSDEQAAPVEFGPYRFEPGNGLWRNGHEVAVPPRALGVLAALIAQPGSVVSKSALMDAVWKDAFVTEASLLEAIRVLREALGDDRRKPVYIQTVHRRGYRFIAPISMLGEPAAPAASAFARATPGELRPAFAQESWRASAWSRRSRPANESGGGGRDLAEAASGREGGPDPWRPLIVAGGAATAAMIGIALVFAILGQRPSNPRPTTRFTIALPEDVAIDPLRGSVAVSEDGTRMVYVALEAGQPRLFLRTIDRDAPERIEGSDGAADPFFSPNGEWVGFFAHGSLKKLRVSGGTPIVLCAARAGGGASWARDGTIVFGGGPGGGLARVSEDGGEPVLLISPAAGSRDLSYGWPDVLPDGSGVLYTAISLSSTRVALFDLRHRQSHEIVNAGRFGRYSPTGHIVFERRGRLEAAPFPSDGYRVLGAPRPILRGLATSSAAIAGPRFAFSRTGSLIYVPGASIDVDERLHWLDVHGRLDPTPLPPAPIAAVDVAPDLQQLAMTVETDEGADLWIGDLRRGALSRLSAEGPSASPTWRPDGLEIAFAYSKAGPFNLFIRPADTDVLPQPLLHSPWNQFPTSWSPDGRRLAFTEVHPLTGADLWTLDLATRERHQVVRTLFDESHARFSPDGRWIAYMSNESGRWDIFVRPAHGGGPRVQVTTGGGAWPCWSVDGRTLYFSANGRAAAAAIETTPVLKVSAPMVIPGRDDLQLASGHAASDRILVRQGGVTPARRELRVVLEWFTELTRLVRLPA